jgi:hypothetical protein
MTDQELKGKIYDWIDHVINTQYALAVPIIYGESNNPRPASGVYIVIHQPFANNLQDNYTEGETDASGNVTHYASNECTVSIEAVRSKGEELRILQRTIDWQTVNDVLTNLGLVVRRFEPIVPIPDNTQNQWELRAVSDFFISYVDEDIENTSYIENVLYTSDYTGGANG